MKPTPRKPITDEQIDRLLGGQWRDTTPEFEARWVQLRRELRQEPVRRSGWAKVRGWPVWLGAGATAVAAALAVVVAVRRPAVVTVPEDGAVSVAVSPALAELLAMDAVLTRAQVLLDEEQRGALLHLPVRNEPKT